MSVRANKDTFESEINEAGKGQTSQAHLTSSLSM